MVQFQIAGNVRNVTRQAQQQAFRGRWTDKKENKILKRRQDKPK